jgi:transcriptional regulator with XRE-family HTH domain
MSPLTPQLRAAYYASGLTMAQIAARAELNELTVCRILNGRMGHVVSLLKVCSVLNVEKIDVPLLSANSTRH